jgi:hypothetical protein
MSHDNNPNERILFRHRVGKVNWNSLTTCSVRSIIEKNNVRQLQKLLDNVTFSEFSSDDVKSQSVDSVAKLVNMMQLIIEYQLQCQDTQMNVLKAKIAEMKAVKKEKSALERERTSLLEDRRVYQRQLKLLRQSLTKAQEMIKYPENIQSMILGAQARVVYDPLSISPSREKETMRVQSEHLSLMQSPKSVMAELHPLVDSVVRGQQESNDTLRVVMDEQRKALKEMLQLVLDQQQSLNKSPSVSERLHMVENKVRSTEVQTSVELKKSIESSPSRNLQRSPGSLQSILLEVAESEMIEDKRQEWQKKENEFAFREAILIEKESSLKARDDLLARKMRETEALRQELIEQKALLDANSAQLEQEEHSGKVDQFAKLGAMLAESIPRRRAQKVGASLLLLRSRLGKKK